jgi:micrococcal nuclease
LQQRLLGYVFLEDGTFVNKEMLARGHGKFIMPPPNKKYAGDLRRAELNARRDRLGLWKEEAQNPFIKNEYIGEKNTKIYYFPTSPELDRIPAAQLVTFKSRVEAKAAGYRPCSTCKEEENAPSWY